MEHSLKGVNMIYNKLVRDKILEIIRQDGKNCVFEYLSDEDYLKKIKTR